MRKLSAGANVPNPANCVRRRDKAIKVSRLPADHAHQLVAVQPPPICVLQMLLSNPVNQSSWQEAVYTVCAYPNWRGSTRVSDYVQNEDNVHVLHKGHRCVTICPLCLRPRHCYMGLLFVHMLAKYPDCMLSTAALIAHYTRPASWQY